jgi:hypothetical protein
MMIPDVLQKRGASEFAGVTSFLGGQKRAFVIELRQAPLKLADAFRVGSSGGFVALHQFTFFVTDFHTKKGPVSKPTGPHEGRRTFN